MICWLPRVLLAFALVLAALPVAAHKASDSYLTLRVDGAGVTGQWDIAVRDLDVAVGLDADDNGEITWGEIRTRLAGIHAYALSRLSVARGGAPCRMAVRETLVDEHSDGAYVVLRLGTDCVASAGAVDVEYGLLFDVDPQHRGLLRVESGGATRAYVLEPDARRQRLEATPGSLWQQILDYFREGVWHIWIGFDHVLFLVSLLLPAVLVWAGRWQAAPRFRPALVEVVKVVTAFTVAHSVTLSLAALGVVSLPSRAVESAIALSVVLAALNNLRPVIDRGRWLMAFAFGLIHGFGFASVLADLGLPRDALVAALVSFNLGVEAGQLAIVCVLFPAAFALRGTAFYRRGVMMGGSCLIALLAALWLIERAGDVKLLG